MRRSATKSQPEIRVIIREMTDYNENEALGHGFVDWQPLYDLVVSDEEIMVSIEIAGVGVGDFSIYATRRGMVIDGLRRQKTVTSRAGGIFHNLEIPYGRFNRIIDFPVMVEPERYEGRIENGMLVLRFPILKEKFITIEGD